MDHGHRKAGAGTRGATSGAVSLGLAALLTGHHSPGHPTLILIFFLTILFGCAVLWLGLSRRRVFAEVSFHDGGFTLRVNPLLGARRTHMLAWTDIEQVVRRIHQRRAALLVFRLTHPAAVRIGLIQPTTREDAPTFLVQRSVTLPLTFLETTADETMTRFRKSANLSGVTLEEKPPRAGISPSERASGLRAKTLMPLNKQHRAPR